MQKLDINCDMGESRGAFIVGNDELLFPYIQSCNIACGFHGGDPLHIENTIKNALKHKVRIGAHPSYPDLEGFGRRKMALSAENLTAIIKYQVAALKGMVESLGGQLAYVKPHGALYNTAAKNEREARIVIAAIQAIDPQLALMGLANSTMEQIAQQVDIPFIAEAFADRRYEPTGQLMSRSKQGAVIQDAAQALAQVESIFVRKIVQASDGVYIPMMAQSICIHGDNPAALDILKVIQKSF